MTFNMPGAGQHMRTKHRSDGPVGHSERTSSLVFTSSLSSSISILSLISLISIISLSILGLRVLNIIL